MKPISKIILTAVVVMMAWRLAAFPVLLEVQAKENQSAPDPKENIEKIQQGRFGLNRVAQLVGIAKQCNEENGVMVCKDPTDIRVKALRLLQTILGFTSLLALIMVIYGGAVWTTAGGSQERVTKGKNILQWSAIGLIVLVSAWGLVTGVMYMMSQVF